MQALLRRKLLLCSRAPPLRSPFSFSTTGMGNRETQRVRETEKPPTQKEKSEREDGERPRMCKSSWVKNDVLHVQKKKRVRTFIIFRFPSFFSLRLFESPFRKARTITVRVLPALSLSGAHLLLTPSLPGTLWGRGRSWHRCNSASHSSSWSPFFSFFFLLSSCRHERKRWKPSWGTDNKTAKARMRRK